MSSPTTRLSYKDCYDLWDYAVDKPNGIRFQVKDFDAANKLRLRLHMARKIDREDNTKLYNPGDKMFGQSLYDPYEVLIRDDTDGCWWVYLEPRVLGVVGEIEILTPYREDLPWLEASEPQKLISHSGSEPLEKKLESISSAPSESSSSNNSMKPESAPTIQGLRRL